ncbi:MAG: hypothetical protein J1F40_02110 [Prevotellaceae bacterium]|nr:hypothetical protein [Prevotellaceae bacterium]
MKLKLLALTMLAVLSLSASAANTKTTVTQVTNGVKLTTDVDYIVTGTTPFTSSGSVDIVSTEHAVLILSNIKPSKVLSNWMNYIYINGEKAVNGENCQVKMYSHGAIIFPYAKDMAPLTCYTEQNFEGESCNTYTEGHSGGYMKSLAIATLNNKIRSFKLKRGYMVTFAIGTGGWGYSRCFIADQEDLEMKTLPAILDKRISSYRIFKWHNAKKAGLASNGNAAANQALNSSWCYDWAQGNDSNLPDTEWVPNHIYEDYPTSSVCGSVTGSCHMKTNNEPGNSADDHPQTVEVVLDNWQNLMRTGMRLCSESSHDGSMNHLKQFIEAIDARGWRCDILDLHCYWNEGQFTSGNLEWYSSHYGNGRPIWISEWIWGASWNHNGCWGNGVTDTQILNQTKNILTTLNNTAIIERYAYWNSESKGHIYENGRLTSLGQYYANMDDGLGYKASNEYIPKTPPIEALGELTATYNQAAETVTLKWNDPNGDLMDKIEILCKQPETTSFTAIETVEPKDKNSKDGASYSCAVSVDEPGVYYFRISAKAYDGKTYTTNDVTVSVAPAQGTSEMQYGKFGLDNLESNTIRYSEAFENAPCVFIGTITNNNTSLYASNNTGKTNNATYFTYQLFPWQSNKGSMSKNEEVPFLALQEGNYTFGDMACEVGLVKANKATGDEMWTDTTEVTFSKPFPEGVTPVVLTEIRKPSYTSGNLLSALTVRIFDVTNTGFKFIIYSEYKAERKIAVAQDVCYLAITPGLDYADNEAGILIAAGQGKDNQIYASAQRENKFTIDTTDDSGNPTTEQLYLSSPVVLTQLQTNNSPSVTMLRRTDSTAKDDDGNTWVVGTKVKRILDVSTFTVIGEDGTPTSVPATDTNNLAIRDNLGWVTISKAKEGGTLPTSITVAPANKEVSTLAPRVVDRRIIVDGTAYFEVYSIAGAKLDAKSSLEPGIYVVKANGKSAKVVVK